MTKEITYLECLVARVLLLMPEAIGAEQEATTCQSRLYYPQEGLWNKIQTLIAWRMGYLYSIKYLGRRRCYFFSLRGLRLLGEFELWAREVMCGIRMIEEPRDDYPSDFVIPYSPRYLKGTTTIDQNHKVHLDFLVSVKYMAVAPESSPILPVYNMTRYGRDKFIKCIPLF